MVKKYILLIISSIVLIYILVYFYDKRENFINKKYYDDKNNIEINYPYFNDYNIDNYITDYLNSIIDKKGDYKLFVDYDYSIDDGYINLILYSCKYNDSIINKNVKNIVIDSNMNYEIGKYNGNLKNYCIYFE